jgi:hypothetical protein
MQWSRHAAAVTARVPISSSPSNTNFTLTGRQPAVAKNASATAIGISIGPLSSDTPQA